jgi:hypothetical protein
MKKSAHKKYPRSQKGITQDPRPGASKRPFKVMGTGYDFKSAKRAGLKPDKTGHWPSRDPKTGLLLKGRGHPTWHKTVEGEKKVGYEIYKAKNGRYYSRKKK